MRAKAKSSSTPYPIWVEGEYITEPPIRPSDGAVRPAGHYIDKGGYPGANVWVTALPYFKLKCLKCGQISLSCAYMAKHKGCGGYYTVDFATKIYRERAKEKELA